MLLQRWRDGEYTLIASEHTLGELERTLSEDRYFAARQSRLEVAVILSRLRTSATVTELTVEVRGVATHPDDLVLSTALSGEASVLCTRDKQLLRLGSYESVAILSPGELLALLETEAPRRESRFRCENLGKAKAVRPAYSCLLTPDSRLTPSPPPG